jgi:hypothetical protein
MPNISSWAPITAQGALRNFDQADNLQPCESGRREDPVRRIERTVWYVESHLNTAMSLDDIAKIAGISKFALTRVSRHHRTYGPRLRAGAAPERGGEIPIARRSKHF